VLDVIESLFMTMFDGLKTRYAAELEAVQGQYPFTPIQAKPLRLTFAGGGSLL
jgi:aspartyl-tRNA synthetase